LDLVIFATKTRLTLNFARSYTDPEQAESQRHQRAISALFLTPVLGALAIAACSRGPDRFGIGIAAVYSINQSKDGASVAALDSLYDIAVLTFDEPLTNPAQPETTHRQSR
jgi:hypothetical protein